MEREPAVVAVTNKKGHKSEALTALMGAALALPGINAQAAEQGYRSDQVSFGYHHTEYKESGDRMSVTADQLSITVPIGQSLETNFTATKDVTSGASPVVNFLDGEGKPHQFLETGASIEDQRDIYEGTLSYYGDGSLTSIKLGTSEEDDYESNYSNISVKIDINDKLTNLSFGYGHSDDKVWNSYNPNVLLEEPSIFNNRRKDEFSIGIGQVINRDTILQFSVTYVNSEGFLSDPYKKSVVVDEALIYSPELLHFLGFTDVSDFRDLDNPILNVAGLFSTLTDLGVVQFLNDSGITAALNKLFDIPEISAFVFGLEKDNRPESRNQIISLLRLSHYFESTNSALHADYRYSDDDWGVYSHTMELKWNVGLGLGWQVSPGVRYYTQHSAYFYDTFFETIPEHGYLTSDYRLAGFGAISKKLEISKSFGRDFTLFVHYEEYDRRYDFELGDQTNGGELDDYTFSLVSVSFDASF
ncbi:hypothetical protein A9Q99_22470 [Gammaproteobacteria bacterium 45_16_T64]|nr:hypothetical protein A9Q99_22470 [Gammaproteobacteria bacterium 45_16_T64]